jgi:hypothetical protein
MVEFSEEVRYRLQKMFWDRVDLYIFASLDGRHGGHDAWRYFLDCNGIVTLPGHDCLFIKDSDRGCPCPRCGVRHGGEAMRHGEDSFVFVASPATYGVLKVPRGFAEKALAMGFLPTTSPGDLLTII